MGKVQNIQQRRYTDGNMKKYLPSHIIMDLQTKTTWRHYYKPIRRAKVSNTDKLKSWHSHSLQMGMQNGPATL